MKKIIAMIVLFTIMTGCGKTARLERLEREREAQIAAEQSRIEAARLANRSFLKKSWDHIWTHKLGYGLGALVAAGTYYLVSHFPKPKQQEAIPQGNNNPEENIHQPNLGADAHQNIAEPEIHNDGMQIIPNAHPAQNPQQNVPQIQRDRDRQRWWEEDSQLWMAQQTTKHPQLRRPWTAQEIAKHPQLRRPWTAQQIAGHQRLRPQQRQRLEAFTAVLDAESRAMSSPENSVKRMVLNHQLSIALRQWEATHRIRHNHTPEKMPTPVGR